MIVTASAPGKAILFGEHSVVYGKPAIAVAVDRRARVTIQEGTEDNIQVKIPDLDVYGVIDILDGKISSVNKESSKTSHEGGILEYIHSALIRAQFNCRLDHGLDITVALEIPIGAGLGSSAAITVATLAAAAQYNGQEITLEELAHMAHQVELEVQGAASPLDTTLSTYGGFIYFTHQEGALRMKPSLKMPLVVGYTSKPGNTGILIKEVRQRREAHPNIINPILDSMENITNEAREAIIQGDQERIGELMNINQGLLDSLGVNTRELSRMIYQARSAGAIGSKITGAGGGGSMIAYCPGRTSEVLKELKLIENAFQIGISSKGVTWG